jgi:hypothetical protein
VAIATFQGAFKTDVEAEAALLARVQQFNGINFLGYTYDEEQQGFLVTELMENRTQFTGRI